MLPLNIVLRFIIVSGVSAVPTTSTIQNNSAQDTLGGGPDPGFKKRCTWDDGIGPIECGHFSVLIGGDSITGPKTSVKIRGQTFVVSDELNCDGDQWKSYDSALPYTVDIHGGNACLTTLSSDAWDNTWINYAGMHVDVPSDIRCGDVWTLSNSRRCIIPSLM
ncbi:hypothetical protein PG999_004993 [Apiospora kogelbergensis]|uniref:Uncharacterized protein n=1 Tax=Apiospora kogelbergensis TaxID=1337665 RepID=A0AAW0R0X9_9PEZI